MSQAKGSNTKIVVGIESAYGILSGTSPAFSATKQGIVIPYASFNVKNAGNQITSPIIRGSRNPIKPARGNKNPSGTLSTLLTPHMYSLFAYLLGKRKVVDSAGSPATLVDYDGYTVTGENVAAAGTAPFTNTFAIGEIPSFTLERQFAGLDTLSCRRFLGCCMNTGTIKIPVEGYIGLDFDIMAAQETVAAVKMATASYETEYETRPFDSFELLAADIKIGTPTTSESSMTALLAVICIDSISDIKISNNLGGEGYVLGGLGVRQALPSGTVSVSGTCKVMFSDSVPTSSGATGVSLVLDANNGTEKSIELKFTRGTGAGTADNEYFKIIIPELMFAATSPVIEGPTGVYAELAFTGYYEDSTINGQTSGIQLISFNSDYPKL